MLRKKVLLLGNGINRINNDYSWKKLLEGLLSFVGKSSNINLRDKPFPLLYEEIYLQGLKHSNISESEMKAFISGQISKLLPNILHSEIIKMNFQHILTTNYDYTLEKSLPNGLESTRAVSKIKEKKYSVLRSRKNNSTNIWHIHGEQDVPNSLTLGYEHYSGYLQQMRNYLISGLTYKKTSIPSLIERLKRKDTEIMSWIDLFFQKDIYILGLNLDFAEIHLWWLLTYIARKKRGKRQFSLNNSINYIHPSSKRIKNDPRLQLLDATDVKLMGIDLVNNDWERFYMDCLEYIGNSS